jgi:hypothetical protein
MLILYWFFGCHLAPETLTNVYRDWSFRPIEVIKLYTLFDHLYEQLFVNHNSIEV